MIGVALGRRPVQRSWLTTLVFGLALACVPTDPAAATAPFMGRTSADRNNSTSPLQPSQRLRRAPLFLDANAQNFLMNYGYIPPSDRETGNLRSEDQLRDALRNLQHFGNIPETGDLDMATLSLMKRPRCGLPDVPQNYRRRKRYVLHGQKWPHINLTWSLRSEYIHNLDHGRVRGELYRALQVWAKHSKLTFAEVNSDRADILVYFHRGYHGDGYEFDGRGKILAHAFFPGSGRGGDAHFDEEEVWNLDPYMDAEATEGTSLFAVAAHEFGHSLGLGHSSVKGALMYPWYQGLPADFELPDDDRNGVQQLYGAKEEKQWGRVPQDYPTRPYRPSTPPPTVPTSTTTRRAYTTFYRTTSTVSPRTTVGPYRTSTLRPHYRHRPTVTPRRPNHPPKHPMPDTCDTSYDAVALIRGEVFIFKDKFLWRIDDKGLQKGYPTQIDRLWYDLPSDVTHIDAVYERNDKKIVFFSGRQYYLFDANRLLAGFPRPLTDLGLPRDLPRVDAAMVWGHNSRTYLFSGSMYWRYDEEVGRVELDYPRDMGMWKGIGYDIDAVFQWKDGKTYFFKGKKFWKFNDLRMRVEETEAKLSAPFWMGCPRSPVEEPTTDSIDWPSVHPRYTAASSPLSPISNLHFILLYTIYLFFYV